MPVGAGDAPGCMAVELDPCVTSANGGRNCEEGCGRCCGFLWQFVERILSRGIGKDLADSALFQLLSHVMCELLPFQEPHQLLCEYLPAADLPVHGRSANINMVDDATVVDSCDINLFEANVDNLG